MHTFITAGSAFVTANRSYSFRPTAHPLITENNVDLPLHIISALAPSSPSLHLLALHTHRASSVPLSPGPEIAPRPPAITWPLVLIDLLDIFIHPSPDFLLPKTSSHLSNHHRGYLSSPGGGNNHNLFVTNPAYLTLVNIPLARIKLKSRQNFKFQRHGRSPGHAFTLPLIGPLRGKY